MSIASTWISIKYDMADNVKSHQRKVVYFCTKFTSRLCSRTVVSDCECKLVVCDMSDVCARILSPVASSSSYILTEYMESECVFVLSCLFREHRVEMLE